MSNRLLCLLLIKVEKAAAPLVPLWIRLRSSWKRRAFAMQKLEVRAEGLS